MKTPLETALESELAKRGLILGDALYRPDLLMGINADVILASSLDKKDRSAFVHDAIINGAILSKKHCSVRRRTVEINGLKIVHDLCVPYEKAQVPEVLLDCIVQSQLLKKSGKNIYELIQYFEKGVDPVPWMYKDVVTETPRLLAKRQYSEPVEAIAKHVIDYADALVQ